MKLGMNLLLWTTYVTSEHFPILQKLKETGFDGVEIPIDPGNPDNYDEVAGCLQDLGLEATTVTTVNTEASPVSPDLAVREAAVDRLNWAIDTSARLGSRILCGPFHSPHAVFSGQPPTPDELSRCVEVLGQAAEHAGNVGVDLSIEHLNRFECYLMNTAAQACEVARRIDHPSVGILYDTHHAHIEEKDVVEVIRTCAPHINHVHVSESDRGTPGRGQVHWEESFRTLREIGYDRWVVIEAFSRLASDFANAIKIWRSFSDPEEVYEEGLPFVRRMWETSGRGS